jgi:hypothetical protein
MLALSQSNAAALCHSCRPAAAKSLNIHDFAPDSAMARGVR